MKQPEIFHLEREEDHLRINDLIQNKQADVLNRMDLQIKELIEIENAHIQFKDHPGLMDRYINEFLDGKPMDDYGNMVYYPWLNTLVQILPEDEFIRVRTNRNYYKITPEQQRAFSGKSIGVIGLSVGQAIAIAAAQERIAGEIRVADMDDIELSNYNRLRAGLHQMGFSKASLAAQAIWEMDPYIKVRVFDKKLDESSIDSFIHDGGTLDAIIEECDSLDMKIIARVKAKEAGIPVVMDTNDRGMIDVERFDLDPDYPLLHGLVGDLDMDKLKSLKTAEEKVPYLLPMIGIDETSLDLRASMLEIENTITSWPQLASSVALGSGAAVDVTRRILMGRNVKSGRYYVDVDQIIPDHYQLEPWNHQKPAHPEVTEEVMHSIHDSLAKEHTVKEPIGAESINRILEAAVHAPSTGNNQPWHFYYSNNTLSVFHNYNRSHYFWDKFYFATSITLGMLLENIELAVKKEGLDFEWTPLEKEETIHVATIRLNPGSPDLDNADPFLIKNLFERHTNRNIEPTLDPIKESELERSLTSYDTSILINHRLYSDRNELNILADILGRFERIRLTHPLGFQDFLEEVRWDPESVERMRDGVDMATVDVTAGERAGFEILKNIDVFRKMMEFGGGDAFSKLIRKQAENSAIVGVFTAPNWNRDTLLKVGKELERHWIAVNGEGFGYQPIASCCILQRYVVNGHQEGITEETRKKLTDLQHEFNSFLNLNENECPVFLYRLFKPHKNVIKSVRLPKESLVTFV